jgi:hypothetical protein
VASARGLANHSLYMARLLAGQWRASLAGQAAPEQAMNAAFAPALQLHLRNAYGWFLLATIRATALPDTPPHRIGELPELSRGIVEPGELEECRQLELGGWLAQLQAPIPAGLPPKTGDRVLASSGSYPQLEDFEHWITALDALFDRLGESLDEN